MTRRDLKTGNTDILAQMSLVNGAEVSSSLAVLGETVRQADLEVRAWLRRINVPH
jgi:hypothetical protein